jgi:hypothetical protein
MEGEYSHGLMGGNMRESTLWTRKKDMECSIGLMEGSMWGSGLMGNNMEEGLLYLIMEHREKESGILEKELSGLMNEMENCDEV